MCSFRILCVALAAMTIVPLGCSEYQQAERAAEPLRLHDVAYDDVMEAAEETLSGMCFVIDKLDAEQGIIRTQPLRGAQLFEIWRSDNVGPSSTAEANLHTIRRFVELHVGEDGGLVWVDCNVRVQRLSLPENEVASVSQAYRMHSQSRSSLQRLELSGQQKRGMAWIDLGQDKQLAARILERLEHRLGHVN